MGVVTGVIGCLQALEAIKIIVAPIFNENAEPNSDLKVLSGTMLIFDAMTCRFRSIKLRPRRGEATEVIVMFDARFCSDIFLSYNI